MSANIAISPNVSDAVSNAAHNATMLLDLPGIYSSVKDAITWAVDMMVLVGILIGIMGAVWVGFVIYFNAEQKDPFPRSRVEQFLSESSTERLQEMFNAGDGTVSFADLYITALEKHTQGLRDQHETNCKKFNEKIAFLRHENEALKLQLSETQQDNTELFAKWQELAKIRAAMEKWNPFEEVEFLKQRVHYLVTQKKGLKASLKKLTNDCEEIATAYALLRNARPDIVRMASHEVQTDETPVTSVGMQTETTPVVEVGIQTESATVAEMGVQTESAATESLGIQTESATEAEMGVQTESATVAEMGVQTESAATESAAMAATEVQTESPAATATAETGIQAGPDVKPEEIPLPTSPVLASTSTPPSPPGELAPESIALPPSPPPSPTIPPAPAAAQIIPPTPPETPLASASTGVGTDPDAADLSDLWSFASEPKKPKKPNPMRGQGIRDRDPKTRRPRR